MSHKFLHMNFPIVYGPRSSKVFGLADTGARINLVNLYYHHSVAEQHPNLVLKFSYLKDLDEVDPFNISGVDG